MNIKAPIVNLIIVLTSMTIIACEIILARIYSIIGWQSYISVIISLAMLGFGASGSFITLLKHYKRNLTNALIVSLFLFPFTLIVCFAVFSQIPLNPFRIGIDSTQIYFLLTQFFLMVIPFFFGSMIIGIILSEYRISVTYFYNLTGSGIGGLAVLFLSFFLDPYLILFMIIITGLSCFIIASSTQSRKKFIYSIVLSIVLLASAIFGNQFIDIKNISEYKGLSIAKQFRGFKVLDEKHSPFGQINVVEAEGLRKMAGISLKYRSKAPQQKIIYFDGDNGSPINKHRREKDDDKLYVNHTTSALAYRIIDQKYRNNLCVLGVGGGESLLRGLTNNFKHIYGLELNPDVIELMKGKYKNFSGEIYTRENVRIINSEARSYFRQTEVEFDLIDISLIDSFSSAGMYSTNESYIYTVNSVKEYYNRLSDKGILSITRWILSPPRDNLRLINTYITALKELSVLEPAKHLAIIRSARTITLLLSRCPIDENLSTKIKRFADKHLFELCYLYGLARDKTESYIKVEQPKYFKEYLQLNPPYFYNAAKLLLSEKASDFVEQYPLDISPVTDDKPFFKDFIKSDTIKLIRDTGVKVLQFTEWGHLVFIIILIPVVIISFILIIVPLFFLKRERTHVLRNSFVLAYFTSIGLAFFLVEIPLIQKFILFLPNPIYSMSIILSSLLVFSGIGSYFSKYITTDRAFSLVIAGLITTGIVYNLFIDDLFGVFIGSPEAVKIIVTVIITLPIGILMGIPFPYALEKLKAYHSTEIPWAYGINGFASVMGIIIANIFSIIFGFFFVVIIALLLYFMSLIFLRFFLRNRQIS